MTDTSMNAGRRNMNLVRPAIFAAALALGLSAIDAEAAGPADGEKLFKRSCAACHTTEAGKNRVGPSLFNVYGRASGSVENFKYSDAMKNAHWTWDEASLDKYLTNPKAAIPGNKIVFVGLKKEDDRKNVISYLETLK
jgi:cytochrome c